VGPSGFGLLTTAFPAGAFLMSFLLLLRPPVQRSGRALMITVAAFGAGTILFGLSRDFYLSLFLFFLIGAADQIGLVMRHTTIQMATPDHLRGRVSSVNQVFTQSSNQINAFESGLVASVTNATFAVVSGGIGTLIVVGTVAWRLPRLWAYRMDQSPGREQAESVDEESATEAQPLEVTAAGRPEAPARAGS
jgi:MFS family permease